MPRSPRASSQARRNSRVAAICAAVFFGMVGAAFASVPLYRAFCQATGFAGTVRRAHAAPGAADGRTVVVRFDTNVRGLAWDFRPDVNSQTVKLGESKLAFFRVTNTSNRALTGRALYNVAPDDVGPYFSKLECFCFKNQTLQPGQTMEFPVVYYVDPRFGADTETKGIGEITLSYTFYPAPPAAATAQTSVNTPPRPLAAGAVQGYSTTN
jgi:cytochrome c oxidase assembly protein subunit 11